MLYQLSYRSPDRAGAQVSERCIWLKRFFLRPSLSLRENPATGRFPAIHMSQPRALLIADSPGLALFAGNVLAGVGLEVTHVRDAESGLAQLRTPQPVLVALDLLLPGMNGIEFIRNLRVQRAGATPPVIVLPLIDGELAAAATAAGAARVLMRDSDPLRTLALLAHTQARLTGQPSLPAPPPPSAWVPCAQEHVFALHDALHSLTRDPNDIPALRTLNAESHRLAEVLSFAGELGLSELATAMEALLLGLRSMETQITRPALVALGQTLDFLSTRLENHVPGEIRAASGSRVLIVDDEANVCHLVSAALATAGLKTHTADSPSACLTAAGTGPFELVILDIGLPEMTGFDLCTRIRSIPGHERVPILFLTGLSSFQNRAKSVLTGGNDFIPKPFAPLELVLKVLLWIQLSRAGKV